MPYSMAYIPGQRPPVAGPLSRYLPPVPFGMISTWLSQHLPVLVEDGPHPWVLDPFGASPQVAIEAARAGYRVLVTANNPVVRFLLEAAANPPHASDLRAALAELAATYKGDERMEPHIRSLYGTECEACEREVMAEAFLWDRGSAVPSAKVYQCPYCGDSGERAANEKDAERASRYSGSGLHRARALERIAPPSDPDRPHAEEALEAYPPRAVFALLTLINKLDSLHDLPKEQRRGLDALLLAAFDQTNTLWPSPSGRPRPRQLSIPPRFWEHNVWLALEAAVEQWSELVESQVVDIPLTTWPDLPPPTGGICLFEGRLKDLGETLGDERDNTLQIGAVISALPRPNQAFWTLSALWAAWLWGRDAAAPFKLVLRRRRYDWAWHTSALNAAMTGLAGLLPPGTPLWGIISESEPGFVSAALISAALASFELEGVALRLDSGQTQVSWRYRPNLASSKGVDSGEADEEHQVESQMTAWISQAAQAYLVERGEPASYLQMHTAALAALVQSSRWQVFTESPADVFTHVQNLFSTVFSFRGGFLRFHGSEHSLEVGQWWLRPSRTARTGRRELPPGEPGQAEMPLADRVEMELVRLLQKNPGISLGELDALLCTAFPGLLTPDLDLVRTCLESYGERQEPRQDTWKLQVDEEPRRRRSQLASMHKLLLGLGKRLGFKPVPGQIPGKVSASSRPAPLTWLNEAGEPAYAFFIQASAVLGKPVEGGKDIPGRCVLVYPGSRAALLAYKLESDSRLRQAVEAGWWFVKFRQLVRLSEREQLSLESWQEELSQDPLSEDDPQIPLL